MGETDIKMIKEKIKGLHKDDDKQQEVIFSEQGRLLVEAPAGYGKTQTMVSKIAYIMAAGQLPYPKKILALTFGINAAYKMKRDIHERLPQLLGSKLASIKELNQTIMVSNYHRFCMRVVNLYGYLLHDALRQNINGFMNIDDSNIEHMVNLKIGLDYDKARKVSEFNDSIKERNIKKVKKLYEYYLEQVYDKFLPNGILPFNAILILALEIFRNYQEVLKFYQSLFSHIIIDEFQDTNVLAWALIKRLVDNGHNLLLMGDSLQRIYGFIGAPPDILGRAESKFGLKKITLEKNHRFKDNPKLLLLDKNIRLNAKNPFKPEIKEDVVVKVDNYNYQYEEAEGASQLVNWLLENNMGKTAILVKQRGPNINMIMEELDNNGINYFFALFREEDENYKKFHRMCGRILIGLLDRYNYKFNQNLRARFLKEVRETKGDTDIARALYKLLEAYLKELKPKGKYGFLGPEEKLENMLDVIENNSLKQQLESIDEDVVVTTVYGAKGLQWDNVILPDMEQFLFPNFPGLCGSCNVKIIDEDENRCFIDWDRANEFFEAKFLEELSVFYVAATRARNDVHFSFSDYRFNAREEEHRTYLSCFLNIAGIRSEIVNSC